MQTSVSHEYNIIYFRPLARKRYDGCKLTTNEIGKATFSTSTMSSDNKLLPPPCPALFALHLAFCKVFHASGMAVVEEDMERDFEDLPCCAADGSTAIDDLVKHKVQSWLHAM